MKWSVEINPVYKKGMVGFFLSGSAVVFLENHGNCSGHRRERGEGSQSTELDRSATFY